MKHVILVCISNYLPGYKSGGPLRSIVNLVEHLRDDVDFRVITADRDLGDAIPYDNVPSGRWTEVEGVQVYYLPEGLGALGTLYRLLRDTPCDMLYLNSVFATRSTLVPLMVRRLGAMPRRKVIIAPRGEFSPGALALKSWKKRPFLALARVAGLYSGLTWQASTDFEADDIRRVMGRVATDIHQACDLPSLVVHTVKVRRRNAEDPLRIVFLSRISPKKNLAFALSCLSRVRVPVEFTIYGPVEDAAYWDECEDLMQALPDHVKATYRGAVGPVEVPQVMAEHDLFFLPTLGENYGHVLAEAIASGTPVLVADTTPWRGLEALGVGRDLPLNDPQAFVEYIEALSRLSADDYADLRARVLDVDAHRKQESQDIERNRALFLGAVQAG
ncbi:glycosyltransferase family 4 protein [Halomonas sp. RA08-2]|uniref:glycosyltransferase family 4 protein n=1 Tax=Halomonas sp. RA08-2 TaxID=3440842 RepID=UPI003EEAE8F3